MYYTRIFKLKSVSEVSLERYGKKVLYIIKFFNPFYYYLLTNIGKYYIIIYDVFIIKID
jgi:hypothetical protein